MFMENFPVYLAQSMKSAGLHNICPRISESTLRRNNRIGMCGPHQVFTFLRYNGEDLSPFSTGNTVEISHEQYRVLPFTDSAISDGLGRYAEASSSFV